MLRLHSQGGNTSARAASHSQELSKRRSWGKAGGQGQHMGGRAQSGCSALWQVQRGPSPGGCAPGGGKGALPGMGGGLRG